MQYQLLKIRGKCKYGHTVQVPSILCIGALNWNYPTRSVLRCLYLQIPALFPCCSVP